MAFDTLQARSALMSLALPWAMLIPSPDGNLDQGDRQHLAMMLASPLAGFGEFPDPAVEGNPDAIVELGLGGSYVTWLAERGTTMHHWFLSDLLTTIAKDEISGTGDVIYFEGGEGEYVGLPIPSRGLLPEYGLSTFFDGVDDGVTLPSLGSLPDTCTVVILCQPSGAGNDTARALIHTGPGALYAGLTTLNRFTFGVNGGTQVAIAHTIAADEAFLLVGTVSGGNARAYVCPLDGTAIIASGATAISPGSHGIGEIGVNAGTNRFIGDLQGATVISEALALADIEALHATTLWTDVTLDVEISSPLTTNRGIHDDSPIARMAATGTCTFVLDNSIRNQAELQSYYSPDHVNGVPGFDYHIPVRVSLPYEATARIQFIGTIHSLKLIPGVYRERRTLVTATDWLDEAARATVTGLAVQANIRPEAILALLINAMRHKPHQVNFQTGQDTYIRALHTTQDESFTVQSEVLRVLDSEFGWAYMRGDGTFVFEARDSRVPAGSPIADHTMTDVIEADIERARSQVKNRWKVTTHPSRVDPVEVVLYSLESSSGSPSESTPLEVGLAARVSIFLAFRSELSSSLHGTPTRIGAIDIVTPLPNVDYIINSAKDGSGVDLTTHPNLTISFRLAGNGAYLDVVNETGSVLNFTVLTVRGFGVYDYAPVIAIKQDDDSIRKHGIQELSLDMPYQPSIGIAELVIDGLRDATLTPRTRVRTIQFWQPESAVMHSAGVTGEIGHLVDFAEDLTGVDGDYYINGIHHEIGGECIGYSNTAMNLIKTTWWLAPRIPTGEEADGDVETCDLILSEDWAPGTSLFDAESQTGGGYAFGADGQDPLYPKVFLAFGASGVVVEADAVESGKNGVRPLAGRCSIEFRINNPESTPDNQMPEGCIKVQWKILNEPAASGTQLFNLPGGGGLSLNCVPTGGAGGPGIIINGFDNSSPAVPFDWTAQIGNVVEFKLRWGNGNPNGSGLTYHLYFNGVLATTWTAAGVTATDLDVEAVNWPSVTWVGNLGKWTLCRGACE